MIRPEWLSRVDACPACAGNTEAPVRVEPTDDGFRAFYACTDCGHRWFTGWREG